ncbi:MAG: ATP-binding protein [Planctomycetaceae bacterium]|nr:ATP-binding protein [Planctomycetaceae bacterium]
MTHGVFSLPLPGDRAAHSAGDPRGDLPPGISRGRPLGEFISGPENEEAVAALCLLLARLADERPLPFQPLVLYGPAGTGKSHLAGGLACELRRRAPQARIVHVFAADFARELNAAIDVRSVAEWQQRQREARLLILEDLEHLAGKALAQEELCRTLDSLSRSGALVVLTSPVAPADLAQFSAALRSRLLGGLALGLKIPGTAARSEILRRLAATRNLAATDEATATLAEGLTASVRELAGALAYLEIAARQRDGREDSDMLAAPEATGTTPTAIGNDLAAAYLAMRSTRRAPSLHVIAVRTAKYYSLKLTDLRGPARHRQVALARSVAIYLARQLTTQSLERIGKYFGGRDHTTVLHASRRIAQLVEVDTEPRRAVEHLRELLAA